MCILSWHPFVDPKSIEVSLVKKLEMLFLREFFRVTLSSEVSNTVMLCCREVEGSGKLCSWAFWNERRQLQSCQGSKHWLIFYTISTLIVWTQVVKLKLLRGKIYILICWM